MENNKNKKSVKFQGDMLNFCDFIQVFVFTTNHHLNCWLYRACFLHVRSIRPNKNMCGSGNSLKKNRVGRKETFFIFFSQNAYTYF